MLAVQRGEADATRLGPPFAPPGSARPPIGPHFVPWWTRQPGGTTRYRVAASDARRRQAALSGPKVEPRRQSTVATRVGPRGAGLSRAGLSGTGLSRPTLALSPLALRRRYGHRDGEYMLGHESTMNVPRIHVEGCYQSLDGLLGLAPRVAARSYALRATQLRPHPLRPCGQRVAASTLRPSCRITTADSQ